MPRKLEGVPRNQLESLIHELDRKVEQQRVKVDELAARVKRHGDLRRQAENQCESMRKQYFDEMARADAEQHQREDLVTTVRDVRVILHQPGHAEDNVEQALKRLEGL